MIIIIILIKNNKNKHKQQETINHIWTSEWTVDVVGLWFMVFKIQAISVLSAETLQNYVLDHLGTYASHQQNKSNFCR